MPRKKLKLSPPKTLQFWATMNWKELRECALKLVKKKITIQWGRLRERSYRTFPMLEYLNGQTLFRLKDKERKMKGSKSLRMMRLKEDKLMLKRKLTNKSSDKLSLIKLTSNSMIIKIWLRLFTVKCFYVMSPPNNKLRENSNKENKPSTRKSTFSGKSLRNKKWLNMMRD